MLSMNDAVNRLDAATLAYIYANILGWPIARGHHISSSSGVCSCQEPPGTAACPAPGAHSRSDPVPLAISHIQREFTETTGAVMGSCSLFDAVTMPYNLAMALMVELDRRTPPVPCLVTAQRSATMLVAPSTARSELLVALDRRIRVFSGSEHWIALPPSAGVRWDTPPWLGAKAAVPLRDGSTMLPALREALNHSTRPPSRTSDGAASTHLLTG